MPVQTVRFHEGKRYMRLVVSYGFHTIGNQKPYFSITASLYSAYANRYAQPRACGCLHNEVAKHFPHLRPLIETHLANANGLPMHFIANGKFLYQNMVAEWWGITETDMKMGIYPRKSYEISTYEQRFRDHCALHDDEPTPILCAFSTDEIDQWLNQRQQVLYRRFTDLWIKYNLMDKEGNILAVKKD